MTFFVHDSSNNINIMIEEERIIKVNIEEEMKASYIDYSMSVIVSRALPDVRDGLKPVHRRVLFGMHELGVGSNKPYKNPLVLWVRCLVNSTRTATLQCIMQWSALLRPGL